MNYSWNIREFWEIFLKEILWLPMMFTTGGIPILVLVTQVIKINEKPTITFSWLRQDPTLPFFMCFVSFGIKLAKLAASSIKVKPYFENTGKYTGLIPLFIVALEAACFGGRMFTGTGQGITMSQLPAIYQLPISVKTQSILFYIPTMAQSKLFIFFKLWLPTNSLRGQIQLSSLVYYRK